MDWFAVAFLGAVLVMPLGLVGGGIVLLRRSRRADGFQVLPKMHRDAASAFLSEHQVRTFDRRLASAAGAAMIVAGAAGIALVFAVALPALLS